MSFGPAVAPALGDIFSREGEGGGVLRATDAGPGWVVEGSGGDSGGARRVAGAGPNLPR